MSDFTARSVLTRMHGREVLIARHYTGVAADMHALATARHEDQEEQFKQRRLELVMAHGLQPMEQRKPFAFSSGIAVIPVHGTLINRFGYSWGYVTGYNFIRQQTALAGQDPEVLGIIYDTNSYGGEAAGCFECSDDIKRLAGGKPTMTIVDSNCYSAAFAMACGTDRIVATPSGGAGSVGVVAMHVSMEKMLADWGLKVTFIHEGQHKVDGNPFEDLPDDVRADIQSSISKSMDAFVTLVAKGRKMDEKTVRATEARIYRADEAKSLGLIDAVATPQEAVQAFLGELSGSNPQSRKKEDTMSDEAQAAAEQQAAIEKAKTEAQGAERARTQGILNCEEAKGRASLASHIAFNTSMSVDDAKAMLSKAPTEATETANPFKETMDKDKHPEVGAGAALDDKQQEAASGILAAAKMAGVRGFASQSKH